MGKEQEIRQAAEQGDSRALELLWDAYGGPLFAFLQGFLASRMDAEEVLQDLFVKLARHHGKLAGTRDVRAYVFVMARNEAVDFIRRNARRRVPVDTRDTWLEPVEPEHTPQVPPERIEAALRELPPEQREVVILKCWQDLTFREIAELLELRPGTVASRYRYALEKLRNCLKEVEQP